MYLFTGDLLARTRTHTIHVHINTLHISFCAVTHPINSNYFFLNIEPDRLIKMQPNTTRTFFVVVSRFSSFTQSSVNETNPLVCTALENHSK